MTCRQAVIFDLDDTLFAEMDFVESGLRAVAARLEERFNRPADKIAGELTELHRESSDKVFNRWLALQGGELPGEGDDTILKMVSVYRSHIPEIQAFNEVEPLIESLHKTYQLGLVSDGYLETQRNKWNALNLDSWFDAVVFSDELGRENWKPSAVPFQHALRLLDVAPENAIYIGDNPTKDFVGARTTGMKSIRYRHTRGVYSNLESIDQEHLPDAEVHSLANLESLIHELFKAE